MVQTNVQGKSNKVAATQETITAQDSTNQSKVLGIFTEEYLTKLANSVGDNPFIRPSYLINTLRVAERFIDKARMAPDQKGHIKMAFGLLASFLPDLDRQEFPEEYIAESYYPQDIEAADPEDVDEMIEAAVQEMGYIANDVCAMLEHNEGGYYDEIIANYMETFGEYTGAIHCLNENWEMPEWLVKFEQSV